MNNVRKKIKLIRKLIGDYETDLADIFPIQSKSIEKQIRMKINILKDIEADYTEYLDSDIGQILEDNKLKKWLKKNSDLSPIN